MTFIIIDLLIAVACFYVAWRTARRRFHFFSLALALLGAMAMAAAIVVSSVITTEKLFILFKF